MCPERKTIMSNGGAERDERFGYLQEQFRIVINKFGGSDEVADKLLSRFRYLEEEEDGVMSASIYRDADNENMIAASWVSLHLNPNRKSLTTIVYLGGLVKRNLSNDFLNDVKQVHMPDEGTVIFENDRGRMVWLNADNFLMTIPL